MNDEIGIKLADGTFYPILLEGKNNKKKFIVTAALSDQSHVCIEVIRNKSEPKSSEVIGVLEFDGNSVALKSEIEVTLEINDDLFTAEGKQLSTGQTKALSLSFTEKTDKSFEDDEAIPLLLNQDEILSKSPNVLDSKKTERSIIPDASEAKGLVGDLYPTNLVDTRQSYLKRKKRNPLMILTITVGAIILIISFGTILLKSEMLTFDSSFIKAVVSLISPEDKEFQQNTLEKIITNEPEIKTDSELNTLPNKAEILTEKPNITNHFYYQIKEGDSLWKLAERFYNDGFQYQKLMKSNTIPDPDNLVVGSKILIPE